MTAFGHFGLQCPQEDATGATFAWDTSSTGSASPACFSVPGMKGLQGRSPSLQPEELLIYDKNLEARFQKVALD